MVHRDFLCSWLALCGFLVDTWYNVNDTNAESILACSAKVRGNRGTEVLRVEMHQIRGWFRS